jgi:hypothetical protein
MSAVAWNIEKVTDDDFAPVQEQSLYLGAGYISPQLQLSKTS